MDINNLPANSHRSKEEKGEKEKKKVEKVVSGKVKTRKKTKASKFTDAFVSENSGGVMEHTVMDILVPAIKNTVLDIVWDGINIMFFGDTKPKGNRGGNNRPNSSYVSYRSYSDNSRRDDRSYTRRSVYEFDDILLESRGEAEDVLDSLDADNRRLNNVEGSDRMLLRCMLVIINHDITGNGIDKLKETRDELNEYLIKH